LNQVDSIEYSNAALLMTRNMLSVKQSLLHVLLTKFKGINVILCCECHLTWFGLQSPSFWIDCAPTRRKYIFMVRTGWVCGLLSAPNRKFRRSILMNCHVRTMKQIQ